MPSISSPESNICTSPLASPNHHHSKSTNQHYRSTDHKLAPSIPSSPTSIHSSSSAIFERDIEPIIPPSPPSTLHNPPNPHRIPRAKHSGQLDQSVPSVLDSAASALATMDDTESDQVAVVAPLTLTSSSLEMGDSLGLSLGLGLGLPSNGRNSGFASPIGSLRSRSPSPLGLRIASSSSTSPTGGQHQPLQPLNLSIPVPHQSSQHPSLGLSMEAANAVPASSSPPKPHSISSRSPSIASPATRPRSISPSQHHSPPIIPMTISHSTSSTHIGNPNPISPTSLSHPPSPAHGPKKRLSFMSYTDLLASTPSTTQPLSSLTSNASATEPPPHIPSVSMVSVALSTNASRAASTTASPLSSPISLPNLFGSSHTHNTAPSLRNVSTNSNHASAVGGPVGGLTHPGMRESIALLDNMGGEWEREGLGMGLEERLGLGLEERVGGFVIGGGGSPQGRVVVAK